MDDETAKHGIIHEYIGIGHVGEGQEGVVDLVEPATAGEELVHEERVLVGIGFDHGCMDGFQVLRCTAFLKFRYDWVIRVVA